MHLNASITFVFEIAYLVLFEVFHAMSTKRTVLSLDQRMKVLRRLVEGIVNVQAMVEEHIVRLAASDKQKCITDFFRKYLLNE